CHICQQRSQSRRRCGCGVDCEIGMSGESDRPGDNQFYFLGPLGKNKIRDGMPVRRQHSRKISCRNKCADRVRRKRAAVSESSFSEGEPKFGQADVDRASGPRFESRESGSRIVRRLLEGSPKLESRGFWRSRPDAIAASIDGVVRGSVGRRSANERQLDRLGRQARLLKFAQKARYLENSGYQRLKTRKSCPAAACSKRFFRSK